MSIGPLGLLGGIAGAPLAQSAGGESLRAAQQGEAQQQARAIEHSENAAGIGKTEEEEAASERDADGRRPWEIGGSRPGSVPDADEDSARQSRDASGLAGNQLDLSG